MRADQMEKPELLGKSSISLQKLADDLVSVDVAKMSKGLAQADDSQWFI